MRYRLHTKQIRNFSEAELAECSALTARHRGVMERELHCEYNRTHNVWPATVREPAERGGGQRKPARAVMLRDEQGQLVAWALLDYEYGYRENECRGEPMQLYPVRAFAYFYVYKDCRRQGLGSRLYRRLQRLEPEVYCCPSNRGNRIFFRRLGAPINPRYAP